MGKGGLLVLIFGLTSGSVIVAMLILFVGITAMIHENSQKFAMYLKSRDVSKCVKSKAN